MVQVFGLYVLPDNECAMLILNCVVGCYETTQNMLFFACLLLVITYFTPKFICTCIYQLIKVSDHSLTLFYAFLVKPISDAIYETGLCQRGVKFFK